MPVPRYTVVLQTRRGLIDVEVPTFQGADAAGRRARLGLVAAGGYGDLDQVTIVIVRQGTFAEIDAGSAA